METLPKKAIIETIEASEEYTALLDSLLSAVTSAEAQVQQSSQCATHQVESTFEELKSTLINYLNSRKVALLESVKCYERESMSPLLQCKQDICARRTASSSLISDAKKVLASGGFRSQESYNDFISNSAAMGALPAVPDVELVPNITFQGSPESIILDLKTSIMSFGSVFKIGPVQITSIDPHPGSLLIRWEEIDFDSQADIQSYRLQMASFHNWSLNSSNDNIFRDLYVGGELEYLVRDLRHEERYCFRVSCRVSAESEWSAWSRVKTASTHVPPFTWDPSNNHYLLSNDNKLARMVAPSSVLFSSAPLITSGHSVRFTLLNPASLKQDEGVALSAANALGTSSLAQPGSLFVAFLGDIFIDGKKKMINLPSMGNRDQLVFCCEMVKGKWRITIESGAKAVTYDWDSGTELLYFATLLRQSETQILVE